MNRERLDEVVDQLIGTCLPLSGVLTEEEMEDRIFLAALDERALECECCGWWYEPDELDDDQVCRDCRGGQDDEED